jgi:DNA polymerase-4
VAIKLRRNDFSTFSRQRRVSPPLGEAAAMLRIASELLDTWLAENPGARLRLLGVGVSGLSPANQLGLFSQGPDGGDLDQTLASIRERFGDHAVARGRTRPRD